MAGMSSGAHVSFSTQAFRALASACRACVHITQIVTLQAYQQGPSTQEQMLATARHDRQKSFARQAFLIRNDAVPG